MNKHIFISLIYAVYFGFVYFLCSEFLSVNNLASVSEYLVYIPSFSKIFEHNPRGFFWVVVYLFLVIFIPVISFLVLYFNRTNRNYPYDSYDDARTTGKGKIVFLASCSVFFSLSVILFIPTDSAFTSRNPMVVPWIQGLLFNDHPFYFFLGAIFFNYLSAMSFVLGVSLFRVAFRIRWL